MIWQSQRFYGGDLRLLFIVVLAPALTVMVRAMVVVGMTMRVAMMVPVIAVAMMVPLSMVVIVVMTMVIASAMHVSAIMSTVFVREGSARTNGHQGTSAKCCQRGAARDAFAFGRVCHSSLLGS